MKVFQLIGALVLICQYMWGNEMLDFVCNSDFNIYFSVKETQFQMSDA